ncbi:hypothetical protein EJB05_04433, partial [Eragrostis curvula]
CVGAKRFRPYEDVTVRSGILSGSWTRIWSLVQWELDNGWHGNRASFHRPLPPIRRGSASPRFKSSTPGTAASPPPRRPVPPPSRHLRRRFASWTKFLNVMSATPMLKRFSLQQNLKLSQLDSMGNWCHEYRKLKAKVETIQKCQKHLMGEELETLNLKELQQLEQQLESSLKHIRSRKSQLMLESISELQRKERSLQEENKVLQKELTEKQKAHKQQGQWNHTQQAQTSSSSSPFMMREAPPAVNVSNYPAATGVRVEGPAEQPQVRIGLPPWMLSHLSS